MPKIRLAKAIGFCSGVKRAIDIAGKVLAEKKGTVYSLGSIIHNHEVIACLEKQGLRTVSSLRDVPCGSRVILPSHGSPQSVIVEAQKKRLRLVDVTCPYVSSVHKICHDLYAKKYSVIIIGDSHHPEVKALTCLAPGARIVDSAGDVRLGQFSGQKIGIISQTTQSKDKFFTLIHAILRRNQNVREAHVFNTICLDTSRRQEEVKKLAGAVDVLVVIGSSTSANTKRLLSLGRKVNSRTYLVENDTAPLRTMVKGARSIGIISGASAPKWLVDRVVTKLKKKKNAA